MARPLRLKFSGAMYHITSRGNEGKKIFRSVIGVQSIRKVLLYILQSWNVNQENLESMFLRSLQNFHPIRGARHQVFIRLKS